MRGRVRGLLDDTVVAHQRVRLCCGLLHVWCVLLRIVAHVHWFGCIGSGRGVMRWGEGGHEQRRLVCHGRGHRAGGRGRTTVLHVAQRSRGRRSSRDQLELRGVSGHDLRRREGKGREGKAQPCDGDAAGRQRGGKCASSCVSAGEWLDWTSTGSVSDAAWRDETGQPTIGRRQRRGRRRGSTAEQRGERGRKAESTRRE